MPVLNETPISRDVYLSILRAALDVSSGKAALTSNGQSVIRFARQAALSWLAAFPGDLMAGLLYARTLISENRQSLALPVLEGLCQADPEFLEAYQLLAKIQPDQHPEKTTTLSCIVALNEGVKSGIEPAAWGRYIWMARRALAAKDLDSAEEMIRQALAASPAGPLAAVTHLRILDARTYTPLQAKRSLAEFYLSTWPDCLQCKLFLADWLMEGGESGQAVALLHQVAARDVSGQVAERLWGSHHTYQPIWPQQLAASLETPIPAAVMAALGWNQLPMTANTPADLAAYPAIENPLVDPGLDEIAPTISRFVGDHEKVVEPFTEVELTWLNELKSESEDSSGTPETVQLQPPPATINVHPIEEKRIPAVKAVDETKDADEEILLSVQEELEKLATRLKQPNLARADGRFPIYVVLSVRSALEKQYGAAGCADIEAQMQKIAKAIESRRQSGFRWGTRIFFADDPVCTEPLGIKAAKVGDPWSIKLALADLDAALARQGSMIGAVLIVGGPEIVPFHHLPNPIDDLDDDVPSDNPYATRDENYFIPEWSVGRLPGGYGNGPALLVKSLQRIADYHNTESMNQKRVYAWLLRLIKMLRLSNKNHKHSYGYTAAIWRQASLSVFKPIGKPRSMLVSPPLGGNNSVSAGAPAFSLPHACLGYFNLHGLSDAAEWYGQRNPNESADGPDFPVALRPEDLSAYSGKNGKTIPEVIFSEACYGMHISQKPIDEALSLKFLSVGVQAIAGSTCMAYGSIDTPLIAADLLGHAFWNGLKEGLAIGEALRRAKIHLAREMHRRQGYLDGEDQKTLISFILYGDPLALVSGFRSQAHSFFRSLKPPAMVKTICDRSGETTQPVSPEVMAQIKGVVTRYLPGMADAELTITQEHANCAAHGHVCPTSQLGSKARPAQFPSRRLVTLSKRIERSKHIHNQVARLTLDEEGNLVKLVVSR